MALPQIPSIELLRDLPLKIAIPDDLRADVTVLLGQAQEELVDARHSIVEAERLTLRAIAHIEGEAARLTQERFAAEDASTLRRRLVHDPVERAEEIIENMRQRVAGERTEWTRRLDKQTRDVVEALRRELSRMELEHIPKPETDVLRATKSFRDRFAAWTNEALSAWTSHLQVLVEGQVAELITPEIERLEGVLSLHLAPELPAPTMPEYRVKIPDSLFATSYEPPAFVTVILGQFKGGLDVIALLASLLVVPVVGQLMEESPLVVRGTVIGTMILAALAFALFSGIRTRRSLTAAAMSAAKNDIIRAVESSFVTQIERFRADVERQCTACMQEALRATMRVVEPAMERFVAQREANAVSMLAGAQMKLDRIEDQLRSIRGVKYALEEQLLVDLRRSLNHA